MPTDSSLRDQLVAVVPNPAPFWKLSKASLFATLILTFLFGKYNTLIHELIAVLTFSSAGAAAIAIHLENHLQKLTGIEPDLKNRTFIVVVGAAVMAVCCGILENSFSLLKVDATPWCTISAKAVSTLLSSLGASIVFAGIAKELSGTPLERYSLKKSSFLIESCKLEYGWFNVKKHITVRNSENEAETIVINVSQSTPILQDSISRCLLARPGDTIEICYVRTPSGYCIVTDISL